MALHIHSPLILRVYLLAHELSKFLLPFFSSKTSAIALSLAVPHTQPQGRAHTAQPAARNGATTPLLRTDANTFLQLLPQQRHIDSRFALTSILQSHVSVTDPPVSRCRCRREEEYHQSRAAISRASQNISS